MRKLIVGEFLTLDGVMQAPGEPNEDRSGGFEHGGWQQKYFDPEFGKTMLETLSSAGGLLLGRKTYEIFAAHWPNQPGEDPVAPIMNGLPKYVASRSLRGPLPWEKSTVIEGDLVAGIQRLKDQAGKYLLVIGSGQLVQTLMKHGLVDEYRLMIHPLVLGEGKRLFPEGSMTSLRLVEAKPTSTGVLLIRYQPA